MINPYNYKILRFAQNDKSVLAVKGSAQNDKSVLAAKGFAQNDKSVLAVKGSAQNDKSVLAAAEGAEIGQIEGAAALLGALAAKIYHAKLGLVL